MSNNKPTPNNEAKYGAKLFGIKKNGKETIKELESYSEKTMTNAIKHLKEDLPSLKERLKRKKANFMVCSMGEIDQKRSTPEKMVFIRNTVRSIDSNGKSILLRKKKQEYKDRKQLQVA